MFSDGVDVCAVDDHKPEPDDQHHHQFKMRLALYVLQCTQSWFYFTLKHIQIRFEHIYFFPLPPILSKPLLNLSQTLLNHFSAPTLFPHSPATPRHSQISIDISLITS